MSTTLPSKKTPPDLIGQLLAEQQSLTAVEEFSAKHESGEVPAQARYYQKLLPASAPAPGQQFSFEVDLDKCSGCKACVVACHTMNGLEEDESWRRVGTITIGETSSETAPRIQHVTTACHHCEDPGCLNGCPVKAYDKDPVTGIVRHLDDQCIGCKYCTMMCPYEVPQYSDRLGIVRKCDMCHQRLSAGEAPACVQSCPNEAIAIRVVDVGQTFVDADCLAAGAPSSTITSPTTVYKSDESSLPANSVPQDHEVDHVAESHWPLAAMLVATQISVGMLLTERVAAAFAVILGSPLPIAVTQYTAFVALVVAGIGMGIAPLHLGQPLRAWRVFLGLRTSWLSREAVVLGKYMGALSAAVGLLCFSSWIPEFVAQWIPSWAAKAALGSAILLGIPGLISSAMIYVATKRQLWRIPRTFARFLGTAATAGPALVAVCMMLGGAHTGVTFVVGIVAMIAIAAKVVWEWKILLSTTETSGDSYDQRSRRLIAGPLAKTKNLRIKAVIAGLALFVVATSFSIFSPVFGGVIGVFAVAAISAGEFAERVLYFQSVVYDRMPGTLK